MGKRTNIGSRLHSVERGNVVAGANEILDDAKGKKQNVINYEVDAELVRLDQSKQDNLTFDNTPTEGSDNPVKSGGVYAADKALSDAIEAILILIPSAATALNQLADKNFVNSSIATDTATFRGTSETGLSEAQFLEWANSLTHDMNDYVFWQTIDEAGNTLFKRYKWNGTQWLYEYTLNNSSFTADQWAAITSGITTALVEKLVGLPTNAALQQALNGKQDALTFDNAPTEGSTNPVKSGGVYSAVKAEEDARLNLAHTVSGIGGDVSQIEDVIPAGATAQNKLVANASMEEYVESIINNITASFILSTADGHINLTLTQVNGRVATLTLTSSDIASAQALTALTGRVSTNETDIANLQQLYNNLQQSKPVPVSALPETGQQQGVIYRLAGTTSYSDYMWNGSSWVLMATYNNAIDPRPKKASQNLVASGGVFDNMGALDVSELNATENPHTLAKYVDLSAALAAIPTDYQKGGMAVKYVCTSDNKYVQYRLKTQSFSTDESDWYNYDIDVKQNSELDGYNIKVGNEELNGILAGYQLGKYYDGTPIDNVIFDNHTDDTNTIWVSSKNFGNGIKHINKIRFVAKEGTIYFYKIYAPQISSGLSISRELIASVVNIQSEVNTIKEVAVDIDLLENEFIGTNGAIAFTMISGKGYQGFNVTVSSNTIAQTTDTLALGYMAIADVDGLSEVIENRQKPLLKTFGISGLGVNTYTPELIFLTEKDGHQPKYIRYIEVESFSYETCIYLVTINDNTATTKLLGSVKNNGTQLIPINIELSDNQRIGISGAMRYISTSEVPLYSSKYVSVDGGNLTNGVVVVDYVLHYAEAAKDNEDKIDSVIVDANGKGDYLTVFDALAGTLGKDSASHPINIIVMPGTYNEPTLSHDDDNRYCSNRYLSIIGVDKVNCILRNDKGYYNGSASSEGNLGDNSVIKVSGNVYIANLTIISTDAENADNPDSVYHRSYCIHNDAPSPQNATLEIHNCILKNNHAPCVGFGIGLNNTMKITDCEIESELWDPADWRGDGGAIYGHDRVGSSAEIQEYVMVKNCYIKCSNSHAFDYIDSNGYLIELTFIGNACDLPNNKGVSIAETAAIGKASCNNNVAGMNYQS